MDRPKRKYQLSLTIGSDDKSYLIHLLEEITSELEKWNDELPYTALSGGYSGNYNVTLEVNPAITHDVYEVQLHEYLKPTTEEPTQ